MWYEEAASALPYRVRWRNPDGSKRSKAFAKESQRTAFAKAWAKQRKLFGVSAQVVDAETIETWHEFARLTGGAAPLEVARWWQKVRGTVGGIMTIDDAVVKYLAHRKEGGARNDTYNHLKCHLQRLSGFYQGRRLADLGVPEMRRWLDELRSPRLGNVPMATGSKRHHWQSASLLFSYAMLHHWVAENPMAKIPAPSWGHSDEIGILTLEQALELFRANAGHRVIGRLALEAFGGLRASSAGRLRGEHIKHDLRGIELPASQHKSGHRHFVEGQPANLWAWLESAPAEGWKISERMYALEKQLAFARARIPHPHNCLRHSFGTYHLHAYRKPGSTAIIMQHRGDPDTLWKHYAGRATQADSLAYFEIRPPA